MASNGSSVLIGISSYLEQTKFGLWDVPAALVPHHYLNGVVAAGGMPVLLPPVGRWGVAEVSRMDGLILTGGPDLDPVRYGQLPHPHTGKPRPGRDASELALLNSALEIGIPVLAVCRGMQVLNVALSGTLHQHLPDKLGNSDHLLTPGRFGRVHVTVDARSRLAGIVGPDLDVLCHHHQGIDALGSGLVAVGCAADGSIEAVELPGSQFVLGVQWHPEEDIEDRRLFRALVAAAKGSA